MSEPESIPEDREQSFQCPNCGTGSVTRNERIWSCDECDYEFDERS